LISLRTGVANSQAVLGGRDSLRDRLDYFLNSWFLTECSDLRMHEAADRSVVSAETTDKLPAIHGS